MLNFVQNVEQFLQVQVIVKPGPVNKNMGHSVAWSNASGFDPEIEGSNPSALVKYKKEIKNVF